MAELSLNDRLCSYMLKIIDESRLSINHIAELAGISQSNLNRVLTEHRPLSQKYIESLCSVLNISILDFYHGALTTPYSLEELQMHTLIHEMDEKQYGALLNIITNLQNLSPKRKTN